MGLSRRIDRLTMTAKPGVFIVTVFQHLFSQGRDKMRCKNVCPSRQGTYATVTVSRHVIRVIKVSPLTERHRLPKYSIVISTVLRVLSQFSALNQCFNDCGCTLKYDEESH